MVLKAPLYGVGTDDRHLVVAIISPFLGTLADYSKQKETILLFMTTISVIFTGLLFLVKQGDILLGMVFFIIAEIGYRGGQVFYNALLIDIADEDELEKYPEWLGDRLIWRIICLLIVLVLIQLNPGNTTIVRFSLVITAFIMHYLRFPLSLSSKKNHLPTEDP